MQNPLEAENFFSDWAITVFSWAALFHRQNCFVASRL